MTSTSSKRGAVTADVEAPQPSPKRVFEWAGENGQTISLAIPRRIKRGKVARRLAANDMLGALDVIFTPEEVEAFEDLDLSQQEWEDLQEKIFEALAGVGPKN
ncbi:hypothetical protein ACQP2T_28080 [Nonomuraea sp. CA-143628]|uniref:hypothetical protein n=1 Tax=Nonomuraea sp. CA-143628 TaxID=3239997 RepID=UPI003D8DEE78